MTNLIIGLCFGIASAAALVIMWRIVERLRRDIQAQTDQPRDYPGKPAPMPARHRSDAG